MSAFLRLRQLRSERRDLAQVQVRSIIAKCDESLDDALAFDPLAFATLMVDADCRDDLTVIPAHIAAGGQVGRVGFLHGEEIYVSDETYVPVRYPLERARGDFDVHASMEMIEKCFDKSNTVPSFPLLDFKYDATNRVGTASDTNCLYRSVEAKDFSFLDPTYSGRAYCQQVSKVVFWSPGPLVSEARHIDLSRCDRALDNHPRSYFACTKSYLQMMSYRDQGLKCGAFVFNPYHLASQQFLLDLGPDPSDSQWLAIKFTDGYRVVDTVYPAHPDLVFGAKQLQLFTYPMDAWSAYFNIRCRLIHPKWFCYDYVSTYSLEIPVRDVVATTCEFIDPLSVGKSMVPFVLTPEYRSSRLKFTLISRELYKAITVTVCSARFVPVPFVATRTTLRCELSTGSYECPLVKFLPVSDRVFYRDEAYYEIFRPPKAKGVTQTFYRLNQVFYRAFSTTTVSYIEDIIIMSITKAPFIYDSDKVIPGVRSWCMDLTTTFACDALTDIVDPPAVSNFEFDDIF